MNILAPACFVLLAVLIIGGFTISGKSKNPKTETDRKVDAYDQPERYEGTKGKEVALESGAVAIDVSGFDDNKARHYNVKISDKTVYFFVVKDRNGTYRAAANECQVCYAVKKGFRQEGNEMVCNNCGNGYPIERIATEKGGCNPAPIDPDLQAVDGKVAIAEDSLREVLAFF